MRSKNQKNPWRSSTTEQRKESQHRDKPTKAVRPGLEKLKETIEPLIVLRFSKEPTVLENLEGSFENSS